LKSQFHFIKNFGGFFLGIFGFTVILVLIPENAVPVPAQRMAAVTILMAVWWITEAIPIPATALVPIVLFPFLKIMNTAETTINYGHHLVFLFLGGFIIALTVERWNLHKRIALRIIDLIGNNKRFVILGFMLASAFLSMWISNTATTMMMIPIGLAVITQFSGASTEDNFRRGEHNFALALMLGIAYASSIGGISTLIGTPPNVVFIGMLKSNFPRAPEISFLKWMLFGLPFAVVFLPMAWLYLVHIGAPVKISSKKMDKSVIRAEYEKLGPMSGPEKSTLIVFTTTAILWMFRSDIDLGFLKIPGWSALIGLEKYITDSTVAVMMALTTFLIPAEKKDEKQEFLMDWTCASRIPWGILLLFGGGFALASGFQASGLTRWLGGQLSTFSFLPVIIIVVIVSALTMLTTEFASNTAIASTILPILAGLGVAIGINPLLLMIPATISCSTAFMLPVSTPPNAIVFGSGYIRIRDMVRIGVMLNLLALILIAVFISTIGGAVFDINWNGVPAWVN
jgi:sodium-dependent dicarboxylate transporter 2/3/5